MKKLTSRRLPLAASILSLSCSAFAQEMEEVVITSSLIDSLNRGNLKPTACYRAAKKSPTMQAKA